MVSDQDEEVRKAAEVRPEERDFFPDKESLTRVIKEFNLSRTYAGLYPADHPQVIQSIDRVYEMLLVLLRTRPSLILGAAKDFLLAGGEPLNPGNPVFREFAGVLNRRDIISITLLEGLRREELVDLHRLVNRSPEEIRTGGGIEGMAAQAGLTHILLKEMDYKAFHLTEEAEISPSSADHRPGRQSDLWQDFVKKMTGGGRAGIDPGNPPDFQDDIDPLKLSEFINTLPSIPEVLSGDWGEILAEPSGRKSDPLIMEKLSVFLRNLRPEIKRRFLSQAFPHVNDRPNESLAGLDESLILEMLEQADAENRAISPALLTMIGELSGLRGALPSVGGTIGPAESPSRLSREKYRVLFAREKHEEYVDAEYDATLEDLGRMPVLGAADFSPAEEESGSPFSPAELDGALDEQRIETGIGYLLAALLEQELDAEDYEVFAGKAAEYAPHHLRAGEFGLLLKILGRLRRRAEETPGPLTRATETSLRAFEDAAFISAAVRAFKNCELLKTGEASALLSALGASCVPELMDLLVAKEGLGGSRPLLHLLKQFREAAVEEALRRLMDRPPGAIRTLLAFIRQNGTPAGIPSLRPLLRHADSQVRLEALSALLSFRDEAAPDVLRRAIQSEIELESRGAIKLAGLYRVRLVASDLRRMIDPSVIRWPDDQRNGEIIRALGRIGDPLTLPTLEKLARRKRPFHAGARRSLKLAIFESLEGYPPENLAGLLSFGRRDKDFRIKAICGVLQTIIRGPL
ncbi:MAG: HEAT repeat domain-containing protein [Candidatus Aminicenantes bacterium]|nr:HEAT repeat domain-containing protein [Candidatus Aminicenantes bacterium]